MPEDGEEADDDDHVVEQGDQRRDAELDVAEPVGDPEHDPDRADEDQDERLADEVGADDRADRRQAALLGDRAELGSRGRPRPRRACPRSGSWCCRPAAPATARRRARRPASRTGPAEPDADGGRARRTGLGLGLALADGLALATRSRCAGRAAALALAPGEPLATAAEPLGARRAAGDGDGAGVGAGDRCSVLISMKPDPGRDRGRLEALLAKTASTWSGVTFGSWNRISQRRAAGVVDGELEARVGERRQEDEEQARDRDGQRDEIEPAPLPDDVKHARAPRAGRRPDGTERDELVVAQAVQRRLARPLLADDPAQDRPGHDDRAEHRDEDADDQDEGEAADDRRAEARTGSSR